MVSEKFCNFIKWQMLGGGQMKFATTIAESGGDVYHPFVTM